MPWKNRCAEISRWLPGPGHADASVEGEQAGGKLGGRISERHAASDGAASPDRPMTDMRHGEGDGTGMAEHERRGFDVGMPGEGADHEAFGSDRDRVQSGQAIDVDERGGRGQSHIQRGDEALPARENAPIGSVALEQDQGLLERGGAVIGKRSRFHAGILP
jgi:hypothetical protein